MFVLLFSPRTHLWQVLKGWWQSRLCGAVGLGGVPSYFAAEQKAASLQEEFNLLAI
jgi:hypothetical protein